ncbi:MAG: hypothetical protein KTR29_23160 [Rhodothermaceae bacterium]|nr:hypothetical protein [Rhodothermaceae bacterium]
MKSKVVWGGDIYTFVLNAQRYLVCRIVKEIEWAKQELRTEENRERLVFGQDRETHWRHQ